MGYAARMKRARRNGDHPPDLMAKRPTDIVLQNPVQDKFAAFTVGNAVEWEKMATAELERVAPGRFAALQAEYAGQGDMAFVAAFREELVARGADLFVCRQDSAKGQHLVLCGAGPSLASHAAAYCPKADQVWGCNSAMTWLYANGHQVTHGFTVDQTPAMLHEWRTVPDVEYLLATTVHPHLTQLLMGRGRRVRFFNNYVGMKGKRPVDCEDGEIMAYEDWLYSIFFPATVRTGSALNSVNRALDLALFMGFDRITVLGADCCLHYKTPPPKDLPEQHPDYLRWLREETTMHADGGHALASGATAMTLHGVMCAEPECSARRCTKHPTRLWLTKPDLIISAAWLEKTRQFHYPYPRPIAEMSELERRRARWDMEAGGEYGRIRVIGDTLPNALRDKRDKFLRRIPTMCDSEGKVLPWT